MREQKFPSLQFMNRDRMRLLLTPPWNGRSMPLIVAYIASNKILRRNLVAILAVRSEKRLEPYMTS
jgi:hypothetical protein